MKKYYTAGWLKPLCLLHFTFCIAFNAWSQPGVLDVTFGNRGKVTTPIPDTSHDLARPWSMALQPDGKILTAGVTKIGTQSYLLLLRYNPNGSLDNTFGNQGKVLTKDSISNFSSSRYSASVALQADGKILCTNVVGDFIVYRFNINGTPDNTFGTNGVARTPIYIDPVFPTTYSSTDYSIAVKVKANGKIVVGGNNMSIATTANNIVGVYAMQYNTNGLLDSSFGTDGMALYPTYDRINEVFYPQAMEIQPDQKTLICGSFIDSGTGVMNYAVVRFKANGGIDSLFGNGGMAKVAMRGFNEMPYSMTIQPDGKIVLAGYTAGLVANTYNMAILRLLPSGIPDPAFGNGGKVISSFSSFSDMAQTVHMQADGKLLVGGVTRLETTAGPPYQNAGDFALVRYNSNGSIDSAYGRNGLAATDFTNTDIVFSSALQPDGKMVLAGVSDYRKQHMFALARYDSVGMTKYNTINGIVFLDANASGTQEAGEPVFTNAAIAITKSNVDTIVANTSNGYFSVDVDSGSYVTNVIPYRPYFTVVPSTYSSAHSGFFYTDNVVFALQPMPNKRDLAAEVVSMWRTIPGFDNLYVIAYHNNGTDVVANPMIQFVKSGKHNFNGAYPNPSSVNGDTVRWNLPALNPQESGKIYVSVTLKPPPLAGIGDTIYASATVSSGIADLTPADNSSLSKEIAQGAYDPNHKTEAHAGSITKSQVNSGEYLTYTIRFQNTGTDTAYNIYIRDTLDSKLEQNTFEMLSSSANAQVTMNDGKCLWFFKNIKLVDSNHNEPASHGYVVYRIKPKATVAAGEVIKNRASIYFDYNLPVETNTETTLVTAGTVPLKLLTFTAKKDGKVNKLKWSTSNEVNVDRFDAERSADGKAFSKIGSVKSKSESESSYEFIDHLPLTIHVNYYRLKMFDKDGSFTYSPVRVVSNDGSFDVSVRPNPVKDFLHVEMVSDKKAVLQIQLISQDGKAFVSSQWNVIEGTNMQTLNVAALQSGTYFLRITSASGEQNTIKFEKL